MRVTGIDERNLRRQDTGTDFVVFIYEGGDEQHRSWSVDGYLITDVDFTEVLEWLRDNLPRAACYSVGVVLDPPRPTSESEVDVAWVLGADLLNTHRRNRTQTEQRIAEGMLARRDRVDIP